MLVTNETPNIGDNIMSTKLTVGGLRQKHPKILAEAWDFSVGDGWLPLIDSLCTDIQHHVDSTGCKQVVAVQIKEKFGGLRFYATRFDDKTVMKMIDKAEKEAENTCEMCGKPGKIRNDRSWIKTLCDECN